MGYEGDRWKTVFKNYERWYGDQSREVVDWYPISPFEIRLVFSDGVERIYNDELQTIQNATFRDSAGDVYSLDQFKREFSVALRSRMRYCGVTQEELGVECDMTQSTVGNYLRGLSLPNVYVAYRMASALDCSVWDLFKFTDKA